MIQLRSLLAVMLAFSVETAARSATYDFENGNLDGWMTYTSSDPLSGGSTGIVGIIESSLVGAPPEMGAKVAMLQAGAEGDYQRLWRDFTLAGGSSISFAVKWMGLDTIYYDAAYDDDGYVALRQIIDGEAVGPEHLLWQGSISKYGNYEGGETGSSDWETVNYTLGASGSYRLEFGVRNVLDDDLGSHLFIDNVTVAEPVPEPAEFAMLGLGLTIVSACARARRGTRPA